MSHITKNRFSEVSEEDLDKLENENYATATHWQTSWAVKVLKGDISIFSIKFSIKINKRSTLADEYFWPPDGFHV